MVIITKRKRGGGKKCIDKSKNLYSIYYVTGTVLGTLVLTTILWDNMIISTILKILKIET